MMAATYTTATKQLYDISDAREILHEKIMNSEYPSINISLSTYKMGVENLWNQTNARTLDQRKRIIWEGHADRLICMAIGISYDTGEDDTLPF